MIPLSTRAGLWLLAIVLAAVFLVFTFSGFSLPRFAANWCGFTDRFGHCARCICTPVERKLMDPHYVDPTNTAQ
jgi:hypothetical protein